MDRPTPANPIPGITLDRTIPDPQSNAPPPELGAGAIAVLEGRTFLYSDEFGDVPSGSVGGLVHYDTRHLGTWVLTVEGERPSLLRSHTVDYYSAAFFLTNPVVPGLTDHAVSIRRLRFLGAGMREKITIHSYVEQPVSFELRLQAGTDFADLFEIKAEVRDRSESITLNAAPDGGSLTFGYRNEYDDDHSFQADTRISTSTPARIEGTDLVWDVDLPGRGSWRTVLTVEVATDGDWETPSHEDFGEAPPLADDPLTRWLDHMPRYRIPSRLVSEVLRQSGEDLTALRMTGTIMGQEFTLPAAGLPWFMTLFGRDTLFTSYQSISVGPELARGALWMLAFGQGRKENPFRDEEPGKIMHEFRSGELTRLGLKPHDPYYGTADATPLWLVMLHEYWRWSGDGEFVRERWENALRALEWIDSYGDRDGDGYVEYGTRSPQGLGNQCWRDSWNGVQFADGSIPVLPIATCEIQGYVYDAKVRAAEIAEHLIGELDTAKRLRREAAELKERFNRDFWIEERGGYYAIGLDGDKRQIDSLTSNIGHLLWSGIVPDDRAKVIARQLLSPELFSGWGVRTLSTDDHGFNPVGYHTGTVWPHDNSIIAAGLARYGFREEANRIALAQFEAASHTEYRLPEVFAGFGRDAGRFPVPYPTSCSPQAWATGAPFLLGRTMLGTHPRDDGTLGIDPHLPQELGEIFIHGIHAFGQHWDIRAKGTEGEVTRTH